MLQELRHTWGCHDGMDWVGGAQSVGLRMSRGHSPTTIQHGKLKYTHKCRASVPSWLKSTRILLDRNASRPGPAPSSWPAPPEPVRAIRHQPSPPPPRLEPEPPPGPPPNASAPSRGNDPPNASAPSRGNGEVPCCESDCSQTVSATRKARVRTEATRFNEHVWQ